MGGKGVSRELRTVLFTVERSDVVASFVVLTKAVFLLLLVKDGIIVPGRTGLGTRVNLALQNIDCTQNGKGY